MGNAASEAAGAVSNAAGAAVNVIPGIGQQQNTEENSTNTEVEANVGVSDWGNIDVGDISLPINVNVGSNNNNETATSEATSVVETTTLTENSNNVVDSNNTEDSNNTIQNSNNIVENSFNPMEDNAPEINKKRWVWFNCGKDKPNKKNIFLSKEFETFEEARDIPIKGAKEAFRWWGRSHVWSPDGIEYKVKLKHKANYDVTLVFAENYDGNYEDGKRVFDISIFADGNEYTSLKDLDVHAAVGPEQYYTHTFWDVWAEKTINIKLLKGKAENPMISGVFIHGPKK